MQVVVSAESLAVALESFATTAKAHLVVVSMDAAAAGGGGGGGALGSTALAVAKKTEFPLLVVKSDLDERIRAMSTGMQAVRDAEVCGRNAAAVVKGFHIKDNPGIRTILGAEARSSARPAPSSAAGRAKKHAPPAARLTSRSFRMASNML